MLLACAAAPPPAPVETSREVAATSDEARRQVEAKLAALGFAMPAGQDGPTRTGRAAAEWAECATVLISGGTNSGQRDFAEPQARSATVTYLPAGAGTRVSVSASFEASYLQRYRNEAFTRPCRTTGTLERELLAAAG